jgi:dolichol-phosphate mannosyltransferase
VSDRVESGSVTLVVPVYNEIELCEPAVRQMHAFMARNCIPFEIVLIESGSTDGSGKVCDALAAQFAGVSVIHEGQRNGMGAALRLGYAAARMEMVWLVTVDLPFRLDTILDALPLMKDHDCVLSFRSHDSRGVLRKLQSWVYSTLTRKLLDLPMRSVNSAFKLFRREFLQSLPLISKGWFLDTELLYWVTRRRLRYAEIPVEVLDRTAGESKVTGTDWIQILRELLAFRARARALEAAERSR